MHCGKLTVAHISKVSHACIQNIANLVCMRYCNSVNYVRIIVDLRFTTDSGVCKSQKNQKILLLMFSIQLYIDHVWPLITDHVCDPVWQNQSYCPSNFDHFFKVWNSIALSLKMISIYFFYDVLKNPWRFFWILQNYHSFHRKGDT